MTGTEGGKLPEQFTSFDPQQMVELEMQLLDCKHLGYDDALKSIRVEMFKELFGLSEDAARRVLETENIAAYWQQISQETGLNFSIDPELLAAIEPTRESLAGIFSAVYGVEPEKLYPAMEARIAARECLTRNAPDIAEIYYQENMETYYTLLKAAIS